MRHAAKTLALASAGMVFFASTALADGADLGRMIYATQRDFMSAKAHFRAARAAGSASWGAYAGSTGFRLSALEAGIAARRRAARRLEREAGKAMPPGKRGLVRMLAGEIDGINLSLLALIRGDGGYAGYIRTRDEKLIRGVSDWQEGIRTAILDAKRCLRLARKVAGPLYTGPARLVKARPTGRRATHADRAHADPVSFSPPFGPGCPGSPRGEAGPRGLGSL